MDCFIPMEANPDGAHLEKKSEKIIEVKTDFCNKFKAHIVL